MAKKLYAITNVKMSGSEGENFWAAGEVVDHTKFSKKQLEELVDNGAVEIRETSKASESTETEVTTDEQSEGETEEK